MTAGSSTAAMTTAVSEECGSFSRLPLSVLTKVLRKVEVWDRLQFCALVNSSWQQAAATATSQLQLSDCDQNRCDQLSAWLTSHAGVAEPTEMSITYEQFPSNEYWYRGLAACLNGSAEAPAVPSLRLAFEQLRSLTSLNLLGVHAEVTMSTATPAGDTSVAPAPAPPVAPAVPATAGIPPAATLELLNSLSVVGHNARLLQLAALPSLQQLSVESGVHNLPDLWGARQHEQIAAAATAAAAAGSQAAGDLAHLWGRSDMLGLTSLELSRAACQDAVLAGLSSLTKLLRLSIINQEYSRFPQGATGGAFSTDGLASLPSSLTYLHIAQEISDTYPALEISPSSAPVFLQLTNLQTLVLKGASLWHKGNHAALKFSPAAISSLRNLRHLSIKDCWLMNSPTDRNLLHLQHLTNLETLELAQLRSMHTPEDGTVSDLGGSVTFTAAEAAALTYSSKLVELKVHGAYEAPLGEVCGCLFPSGRQLSQLASLSIGVGWIKQPSVVQQMVAACAGSLTHLDGIEFDDCRTIRPSDWPLVQESFEKLASFKKLQCLYLEISCYKETDEEVAYYQEHGTVVSSAMWYALGKLTAPTNVVITPADIISLSHVLFLTTLQQLRNLDLNLKFVYFEDYPDPDLCIVSKAQPGCPPDVWSQLPMELLELAIADRPGTCVHDLRTKDYTDKVERVAELTADVGAIAQAAFNVQHEIQQQGQQQQEEAIARLQQQLAAVSVRQVAAEVQLEAAQPALAAMRRQHLALQNEMAVMREEQQADRAEVGALRQQVQQLFTLLHPM